MTICGKVSVSHIKGIFNRPYLKAGNFYTFVGGEKGVKRKKWGLPPEFSGGRPHICLWNPFDFPFYEKVIYGKSSWILRSKKPANPHEYWHLRGSLLMPPKTRAEYYKKRHTCGARIAHRRCVKWLWKRCFLYFTWWNWTLAAPKRLAASHSAPFILKKLRGQKAAVRRRCDRSMVEYNQYSFKFNSIISAMTWTSCSLFSFLIILSFSLLFIFWRRFSAESPNWFISLILVFFDCRSSRSCFHSKFFLAPASVSAIENWCSEKSLLGSWFL